MTARPIFDDHGDLNGLADDDHTQYWLLVGRSGGTTAYGSPVSAESLTLGASSGTDPGIITIESAISVDLDFTDVAATTQIVDWNTTIPSSGAAVTSFITSRPTITVDNGLFIISTVRDVGNYEWTVSPGFAVSTLFLAQPRYFSTTNGIPPAQAWIYACQPTFESFGAGNITVSNVRGLSFNPILRARNNGDRLNVTNFNGLTISPLWNTNNAGAIIDFGTIRGVHCLSPAQVLFGQGLGSELASGGYFGIDFENITFGTGSKVVVRSQLTDATTRFFLQNNGGARSEFGSGLVHFNDNTPIQFGGTLNGADVSLFWNSSGYLQMFFWATSDELRWSSPAADRFLITTNGGNSVSEINVDCQSFSLGAQTGSNSNAVGNFVAGAKTQQIAGEVNQFSLTQAANYTINVAGTPVRAWLLNPASITLSGAGTVTDNEILRIQGNPGTATTNRVGLRILSNPSGGSGINAALWVTAGLSRFDGRVDINNGIALGGGATATLGTIGGSGPTTAAQAQWVEIDVGGVAHWIPAWT